VENDQGIITRSSCSERSLVSNRDCIDGLNNVAQFLNKKKSQYQKLEKRTNFGMAQDLSSRRTRIHHERRTEPSLIGKFSLINASNKAETRKQKLTFLCHLQLR